MFELLSETLVDAGFAAVAGLGFAYASSPPKSLQNAAFARLIKISELANLFALTLITPSKLSLASSKLKPSSKICQLSEDSSEILLKLTCPRGIFLT